MSNTDWETDLNIVGETFWSHAHLSPLTYSLSHRYTSHVSHKHSLASEGHILNKFLLMSNMYTDWEADLNIVGETLWSHAHLSPLTHSHSHRYTCNVSHKHSLASERHTKNVFTNVQYVVYWLGNYPKHSSWHFLITSHLSPATNTHSHRLHMSYITQAFLGFRKAY